MPIDRDSSIEITAFEWVPPFAQGFVRDLRPRWACEEMGLAYRERLISVMDRPDWYFEDQPWGQVPHIRDGAIAVFESGATLIHLADNHGSGQLLPRYGQPRASVLSWLLAAFNSVEPFCFELSNVDTFSRREEWAKLRRPSLIDTIGKRLDRLSASLGDAKWLADDFSIADIAMATVLRELLETELLAERPALSAYLDRCLRRPAFSTALAAQLAAFELHAPQAPANAGV